MEKDQLRVAHLSDLHFLDEESSLVQGFNPYKNLNTIISVANTPRQAAWVYT